MAPIQRLLDVMARLRDPEKGCPWDLEQDFASISPFTIEEAYEVDAAIESGDLEALRDELGDLLFQVVFQARIAEEQSAFDFAGVVEAIVSKLVRRHPHVFEGAATPSTLEEQTATWESIKAAERAARQERDPSPSDAVERRPDPASGIPRSLPALARSAKLAGRLAHFESDSARTSTAADLGPRLSPPWNASLERIRLQVEEAEAMLRESHERPSRDVALRRVGEGLRSWVLLARALGIDPEQALRQVDDARIDAVREAERPAR